MLSSVEYLGYRISAEGLRPTLEKVKAVQSAPAPQDVTQLKSFLGLVNYYGKFLPDLSHVLAPLYRPRLDEVHLGRTPGEGIQRSEVTTHVGVPVGPLRSRQGAALGL